MHNPGHGTVLYYDINSIVSQSIFNVLKCVKFEKLQHKVPGHIRNRHVKSCTRYGPSRNDEIGRYVFPATINAAAASTAAVVAVSVCRLCVRARVCVRASVCVCLCVRARV